MKKVGKTTRPFRYDLNQTSYDYTVEVRNRFKGLDLIDGVPDELWNEVRDIVQQTGIKTIPIEKKCKKSKMAVWGGLTNSCEKKRSKKQRRKGKIYAEVQPRLIQGIRRGEGVGDYLFIYSSKI